MEVLITASDAAINRRLSRFARHGGGFQEAWPKVAESLAKTNERNWARGVKLADSTIAQKEAAGQPEPLVRTGALKASLTKLDAPGAVRELALPHEMRFGTDLFYARFQQKGTSHMQAHRVLRFGVATKRIVNALLRVHLLG